MSKKKTTGHRWTNGELKKLMVMWQDDVPLKDMSAKLKSSDYAILQQVRRMRTMGVPLKKRTAGRNEGDKNRLWTMGEMEYLVRRRNEGADNESIANELGRTWTAVQGMVYKIRTEGVKVKMRGSGMRRLWDPNKLKALTIAMPTEKRPTP